MVRARPHAAGVSNPDKLFFPDDGITKGEFAGYYARVAPTMLPYLRDRPLSLDRHPDGLQRAGFFQKQIPRGFPDWVPRVAVPLRPGGRQTVVVCNDARTLVYLADQGVITPHTWLSRRDKLDLPDRMIFDLDPGGVEFHVVREVALSFRELLQALGLEPFVMTTGSRGLHVTVPLKRQAGFDVVRAFAVDVAAVLVRRAPRTVTTEQRIARRGKRLFLDTNRNAYGQTAAPPYAVRARPHAPVATPLNWEELADPALRPDRYTIRNLLQRLEREGDPWREMMRAAATLGDPRRRLDKLA